jgi:plastocyanin
MRLPAVALGLVGAALAGCGGGEEEEGGRTLTTAAGSEIRVTGREYSFDPSAVVVAGASGKAAVKLTLENKGSLAHNLKVFDGERQLGGTPTFPGGETRGGAVRLGPGRYRMVCTVGNHEQLGMVGRLEVRAR